MAYKQNKSIIAGTSAHRSALKKASDDKISEERKELNEMVFERDEIRQEREDLQEKQEKRDEKKFVPFRKWRKKKNKKKQDKLDKEEEELQVEINKNKLAWEDKEAAEKKEVFDQPVSKTKTDKKTESTETTTTKETKSDSNKKKNEKKKEEKKEEKERDPWWRPY